MRRSVTVSILLGIVLFVAYTIYYILCQEFGMTQVRVLGLFAFIQFVYSYITWYKTENSLFDGYQVFLTASYVFNLGQPILECFNSIDPAGSLLLKHGIPYPEYCRGAYLGMLFLLFMHFGALVATNHKKEKKRIVNPDIKMLSVKKVSTYIAIISFPLYIYSIYKNISVILVSGYMGIYDLETAGVPYFVTLASSYYELSIIALFYCSQYFNERKTFITLIAVITVLVPPLIIGGRSNAMVLFVLMLIIYTLFNKITLRRVAILGILVVVLLEIFAVIARTRNEVDKSLSSYKDAAAEIESNPAIQTITEMGGSMFPLCETTRLIPATEDYRYGATYFWAFTSLIPNLGFWDIHPAMKYGNGGDWLMEKLGLHYGPGFSLTAEAYMNFGVLGFLFFYLYGFLFSRYVSVVNKKNIKTNPIFIIVCILFLWFSIKTVRNSFLGTVRAIFYYCIPFYILCNYYYHRIVSRKK